MSYSDKKVWASKDETFNAATTLSPAVGFCPIQPALIHKIGIRVTNTATGGIDSAVFVKNSAASTTAAVGTIVVAQSNKQGTLIYKEILPPVEFLPGDYLTIIVTETGTAPTGIPVMEYSLRQDKLTDDVNVAVTA